jgi:FtsP/CotA-like multicopper oxidase with cupredoxin domain
MWSRRKILGGALLAGAASMVQKARAAVPGAAPEIPPSPDPADPTLEPPAGAPKGSRAYRPVIPLNGSTLPFTMEGGVKVFRLVAEPVVQEFAPGMVVKCWGYNGQTPGPVIEAVEGDRVRLLVTNKLPEHTTVHWHGLFLPSGMDGVGGLNQPQIAPGETWAYEFTLKNWGTFMYHPHADEMVQMAVGMMGMFIVHPRAPESPRIDRDYVIMLHEWAVHPGTYRPDPAVMLDFNMFSFNSKVFPAISPLVAKKGDRVRVRFGNLSMNQHPIHLHGYAFHVTGDGRRAHPEERAVADDHGASAGGQHARRRVCRRCAGRLGVSLPQIAPHDERDGPRRDQPDGRGPIGRGKENTFGAAWLYGDGQRRYGRHARDGQAHAWAREHPADDDGRWALRGARDGWHVHAAEGARGHHQL